MSMRRPKRRELWERRLRDGAAADDGGSDALGELGAHGWRAAVHLGQEALPHVGESDHERDRDAVRSLWGGPSARRRSSALPRISTISRIRGRRRDAAAFWTMSWVELIASSYQSLGPERAHLDHSNKENR
ncbi:MAG TPA: hypothetical protein DEF51_45360 [Myxococcales bacterium]|nr:hypothetical protein [Myxococcales bacterium]